MVVWSDLALPNLRVHFHIYLDSSDIRKLSSTFEGDPMVGSEVMALWKWYSGLIRRDQASASPISDSTSTPSQTMYGNSRNFRGRSNGRIKSNGSVEPALYYVLEQPNLSVTE